MALAHTIENKVEAAYRRGDLFEKRRQPMEAWVRFCNTLTGQAEVVRISTLCEMKLTPTKTGT